MFDPANGGPDRVVAAFALLGGVVSLWRWRAAPAQRAAVALWLGWTLLFGAVFSAAQGIYHSYYTAALAPASRADWSERGRAPRI